MIVNFNEFSESSVDFFIYTFTKTTNWVRYHEVKHEVLLKVYEIVEKHNADLAFPTRVLQVENIDTSALAPIISVQFSWKNLLIKISFKFVKMRMC